MAHKITPSRQKFRIAKKIAKDLYRKFGKEVVGVFVYGSVAANTALPESDIDILVVRQDSDLSLTFDNLQQERKEFEKKYKCTVSLFSLKKENFEFISRTSGPSILKDGIIPVFGDKRYLEKFKQFYPNHRTIKSRYFTENPASKKERSDKRLSFKRSIAGRKRFLPR